MDFEIIIIGGSYAGLSAAMTLGRALRNVLVIDGGKPCNRQTPHSHNFLTRDGETPAAITAKAQEQVAKYETVKQVTDVVIEAVKLDGGFKILTSLGNEYTGRLLLFATGVTDTMPAIPGFARCWGVSVLHCPYCHGYEVHHQPTGVLGNGDIGFEFAKLISNWTRNLILFTNGKSSLTTDQHQKLDSKKIKVIEAEVHGIVHEQGQIKSIALVDGQTYQLNVLYARVPFTQHCNLPEQLGCELTETGHLAIDGFYRTNILGVYAAGDNTASMRSVAGAVSAGTTAGVFMNKYLIDSDF
jgi:thioredoxin reductase